LSILLPKTPLSASAIKFQETNYICEQHINNTSNIQRTTFANNNLSEDPEKTNIGTVKMMEAKCEVIVIILRADPRENIPFFACGIFANFCKSASFFAHFCASERA